MRGLFTFSILHLLPKRWKTEKKKKLKKQKKIFLETERDTIPLGSSILYDLNSYHSKSLLLQRLGMSLVSFDANAKGYAQG